MEQSESSLPKFGFGARPLATGKGTFPSQPPKAFPFEDRPRKPAPSAAPAGSDRAADPMANAIGDNEEVILLTPEQAAKKLNVGVRTLERWRSQGGGPHYMKLTGKTVRYTEAMLRAYLNERIKQNTAQ